MKLTDEIKKELAEHMANMSVSEIEAIKEKSKTPIKVGRYQLVLVNLTKDDYETYELFGYSDNASFEKDMHFRPNIMPHELTDKQQSYLIASYLLRNGNNAISVLGMSLNPSKFIEAIDKIAVPSNVEAINIVFDLLYLYGDDSLLTYLVNQAFIDYKLNMLSTLLKK